MHVHCCMIEEEAKKEVWLRTAHYADGKSKDPVPGVFTYLAVTLLRPSFRDVSDDALPVNSVACFREMSARSRGSKLKYRAGEGRE